MRTQDEEVIEVRGGVPPWKGAPEDMENRQGDCRTVEEELAPVSGENVRTDGSEAAFEVDLCLQGRVAKAVGSMLLRLKLLYPLALPQWR